MTHHYRRLVAMMLPTVIGVVIASTGVSRSQASSIVPSLEYLGGVPNSCTPGNIISIPDYINTAGSGSFTVVATAPSVGMIGSFSGNVVSALNQAASFGLILNSHSYTFAAHTPITVTFTTYRGANQTGDVSLVSTGAWDCTTGDAATPAPVAVYPGAVTANGFVLKTLVCDTPVYTAPGGTPVGNNAVKRGQTWYVNPVPVKDIRGRLWTEIYVSGSPTSYVPANCVQ